MTSSSRRVRQVAVVLCIALFAACGSDPAGPDLSAVTGTWNLQTANGEALPTGLVEDGKPFTLHSGRMVLSADGSCTNTFTTTPQGEAQKTETLSCTFSLNGSTFSLVESAGAYSGTLNGGDLTVVNDGNSLLYRR